jgi:cbb3-type cytochrome oxidase subunit 3
MKKTIFFLIFFLVSELFAINIDKKEIISPKKYYTVGDIVSYHIVVSGIKKLSKIKDEKMENIALLSAKEEKKRDIVDIRRTYQLFSPSLKKLPDITLVVNKNSTILIKGIALHMKSVLTKDDKDIKDILPPFKKIKTNYSPLFSIFAVLFIILLIFFIYYLFKKIKRVKKDDNNHEEIYITPISFLKQQWDILKKNDFTKKSFYYEITDLLKKFLSRYYGKNYAEMTTYEFEKQFTEDLPYELRSKLISFLIFADKIKFSKYVPKGDEIADVSLFMSGFIRYYEEIEKEKEEFLKEEIIK